MSQSFPAHNELVLNRQLKVQRLVVPFKVVGSATSANVALTNDEPGFVFFQSAGNDQVTPNLASGETATYSNSPNDATGSINILVELRNDYPLKVCRANCKNRLTGVDYVTFIGSSSGISQLGGSNYRSIMLTATLGAINSAVTVDACLEVDYVVDPTQNNE